MEWTREKTLSLITEYRKRRGLWDMTHDDYRKKDMKQKLLQEVSTSLGADIPINEIEKKFHTLRTQYHREINRMKRKQPYNSKWFGYKNLQFLSSPKACRSGAKGRLRSEITEDGTVTTTKYIIREYQHDTSGGSTNTNMNEEFVTINPNIDFEHVNSATGTTTTTTTRINGRPANRALEKLIEETTKDVEDIEEPKPKLTIKEITVPIDAVGSGVESEQDELQDEDEAIETIDLQNTKDNTIYQQSTSGTIHTQSATIQHHHPIPTRIIKIQRRDTCAEDEYYDEQHQQQQQQQQQPTTHHHVLHTQAPTTTKRIYYDANTHHQTTLPATIISATNTQSPPIVANSTPISQKLGSQQHLQQQQQLSTPPQRDEFSTYGEYVANEMRGLKSREVLIALKHKINTSLFEANMAEIQK